MTAYASQAIVPLSKLVAWSDNPRNATDDDLKRLEKQIKMLGQYKPLICCKKNNKFIILGGNMRYVVYKKLKINKIWIVEVKAKTKKEMLRYSLSDNDRIGYYEDVKLLEFIENSKIKIDSECFKIDTSVPEFSIDTLVKIDDYSDLDSELKNKEKFIEERIAIIVPKKHVARVKKFLANGFAESPAGFGKGVMKLCGLL